ncbi:hypothetical protein NC651_006767 [Populus alba x Populus x berolinensis]|nr:hypothetical protein NC651_006767 [Populus alba x Populus x berolinensis]
MQGDEARVLLGFPPNSRPSLSQVKAAYRKKVWESHPDLFPLHEKPGAESKFKLISEAYTYLQTGNSSLLFVSRDISKNLNRGLQALKNGLENLLEVVEAAILH